MGRLLNMDCGGSGLALAVSFERSRCLVCVCLALWRERLLTLDTNVEKVAVLVHSLSEFICLGSFKGEWLVADRAVCFWLLDVHCHIRFLLFASEGKRYGFNLLAGVVVTALSSPSKLS